MAFQRKWGGVGGEVWLGLFCGEAGTPDQI